MSRSFRRAERDALPRWAKRPRHAREAGETFRCLHCKTIVGPVLWGGRHRNHCPLCLHSRHVDGRTPGDRASTCGGKMAPIGVFPRPDGEQMLVHRCLACGVERHNRVAADDTHLSVLRLPPVLPRQWPAGREQEGIA